MVDCLVPRHFSSGFFRVSFCLIVWAAPGCRPRPLDIQWVEKVPMETCRLNYNLEKKRLEISVHNNTQSVVALMALQTCTQYAKVDHEWSHRCVAYRTISGDCSGGYDPALLFSGSDFSKKLYLPSNDALRCGYLECRSVWLGPEGGVTISVDLDPPSQFRQQEHFRLTAEILVEPVDLSEPKPRYQEGKSFWVRSAPISVTIPLDRTPNPR
jgi:hypothetical protein